MFNKVNIIANGYNLSNGQLKKVTWNGDMIAPSRKLEFEVYRDVDIPCGSSVLFQVEGEEVFQGMVMDRQLTGSSFFVNVVAYDVGHKLNKIKISANIKDQTVTSMTQAILSKAGFSVGGIASNDKKVNKLIIDRTPYQIIEEYYLNDEDKEYWVHSRKGKIYIEEYTTRISSTQFISGGNIYDSTVKESIQDMVNVVEVQDIHGNKLQTIQNGADVGKYGVFQAIIQEKPNEDVMAEAKKMLKTIHQDYRIKGYGDTSCVAGVSININEPDTGISGLYLIIEDKHTWVEGSYTVDCNLRFKK